MLGDFALDRTDDDALPTVYTVVERIIHENFRQHYIDSDIALLRLDRKVDFNRYIRPACLVTPETMNERAVVTGWGGTVASQLNNTITRATVTLDERERCASDARRQYLEFIELEKHFCAKYIAEINGPCQVIIFQLFILTLNSRECIIMSDEIIITFIHF